ncbi:DUF2264 domain-containing protein [Sphingobacterium bovistauri]|uniref:DUF2264 domain-containing protein n=1 Tax=Sphingobacterium bovistauri TaxID=2781959 RepID=A0ABS7Z3T3_9SPHI|nr:DUF2264 domain-containing protein [Sphingobacterium bovistauri]MCA5004819.1 DUF2264 domain-containing protein [Sphingobacterium bovistauri]
MRFIIGFVLLCSCLSSQAQVVFEVKNPDYKLSPLTGMNREHWKDAAKYLLNGAFSYVKTVDDPFIFPKQPGKSYPRDGKHNATELLEGLVRTLFLASPLLKEEPNLKLQNIALADYYRNQILKLSNPKSKGYIALRAKNGGPSQILVEFGALAISLKAAEEVLWDPLTKEQKDQLAHLMLSYGDGPTIDMNWRFFNIFILSFFKDEGYTVNEVLLKSLLEKCLNDYKGQGWYTDSPYYDYYSMWGFQMFGGLWSELFGKRHYPEMANQYLANLRDLGNIYPYMFDADGRMIMYGRSIAYRMGASSPLPLLAHLDDKKDINFGWMRRIVSGTVLQFLKHPDFMKDNLPTLGFYGAFEPAVQEYSCRASVFWLGKVFITSLLLPKDNIFWTAKENNGAWNKEIVKQKIVQKYSEGSKVLITDYANIGASEIRSWSQTWKKGYYEGTENYTKLSYNSVFPWQADTKEGVVSMNYAISTSGSLFETFRYYIFQSYKDNVYNRKAIWAADTTVHMRLGDYMKHNGIVRKDTLVNASGKQVNFGHYALPEFVGKPMRLSEVTIGSYKVTVIDNGKYQLALIPLKGWDKVKIEKAIGLHPESKTSYVIQTSSKIKDENHIFETMLLFKKSGEKWSKSDL